MEKLLGGQIALDDFIFAHVKGESREVRILKTEPALGLTITDNGSGLAFIKRIKENSITDTDKRIEVGDHLHSINGENVVGTRHYDVAKKLRDIPVDSEIVFGLVKPLKAFGMFMCSIQYPYKCRIKLYLSTLDTMSYTYLLRILINEVSRIRKTPAWLHSLQQKSILIGQFTFVHNVEGKMICTRRKSSNFSSASYRPFYQI